MSYYADPQNQNQGQTERPLFYRAPTPYLVEPPAGSSTYTYTYTASEPPAGAYYYSRSDSDGVYSRSDSNGVPPRAYPPHYTAPTPRCVTPEPREEDAYPTPEASPHARQYRQLLPEGGDVEEVHALLCARLREGEEGRDCSDGGGGQGQGDGDGEASASEARKGKGLKKPRRVRGA
jgi:hypothetical protein